MTIYRVYFRRREGGADLLYEGPDADIVNSFFDSDEKYPNARLYRVIEDKADQ